MSDERRRLRLPVLFGRDKRDRAAKFETKSAKASAKAKAQLRPVLKPYAGVRASFSQRYSAPIIAVTAALFCVPYGFYYALVTPWLLAPFLVPLIILMALTIWVLPESRGVPERTLEHLFFTFLFALVLWPNYLAISLPGLPWITMSRLFGIPAALLFLVCISINARFRAVLASVLSVTPLFPKILLVLISLDVISMVFSSHIGESISNFGVLVLSQYAAFFIGCYVFRRPTRPTFGVFTLWIMAMIISAIAWVEAPRHHILWVGHIPSFLKVGGDAVARMTAGIGRFYGGYRVQSTFSGPLILSEFLALIIPFVVHLAASRSLRPIVRWMAGVSIPFIFVALLGTDSRLGLLGFFIAIMAYLLWWAIDSWRRKNSLIGLAVVLAYPATFLLAVASTFLVGRIRAKVWGTGQYGASNDARKEQFHLALPHIMSHPLGHGLAQGAMTIGWYTPGGILSVDSFYLDLTVELGFPGLITYILLFSYLVFMIIKELQHRTDNDFETSLLVPIAITIVEFLAIKTVFTQEDNHPLIFSLCGMAVALIYRNQIQTSRLGATDGRKVTSQKIQTRRRLSSSKPISSGAGAAGG